jgi:hypothetical protein
VLDQYTTTAGVWPRHHHLRASQQLPPRLTSIKANGSWKSTGCTTRTSRIVIAKKDTINPHPLTVIDITVESVGVCNRGYEIRCVTSAKVVSVHPRTRRGSSPTIIDAVFVARERRRSAKRRIIKILRLYLATGTVRRARVVGRNVINVRYLWPSKGGVF